MPLTASQTRHLRGLAHALNPVVYVGHKGITEGVVSELQLALDCHELVKVKLAGLDREEKLALAKQLVEATGADLVQRIGHVVCLYRRHPEAPRIELPR